MEFHFMLARENVGKPITIGGLGCGLKIRRPFKKLAMTSFVICRSLLRTCTSAYRISFIVCQFLGFEFCSWLSLSVGDVAVLFFIVKPVRIVVVWRTGCYSHLNLLSLSLLGT